MTTPSEFERVDAALKRVIDCAAEVEVISDAEERAALDALRLLRQAREDVDRACALAVPHVRQKHMDWIDAARARWGLK